MEVLAITNNLDVAIQLIVCKTVDEAVEKMKEMYTNTCNENQYDYYNTYIDEEGKYAQIVDDLKQTEFRIGYI